MSFGLSFSNPYPRNLCPYCFAWFYWRECDIVAAYEENNVLRPGTPGAKGGDRREDLGRWSGLSPRYRCPNERCRRHLPFGYDSATNVIVGIVGGTGSAKTHYIAMLIYHLRTTGILGAIGCKEFQVPPGVRDRYSSEFYPQLIRDRGVLGKTPPTDQAHPVEPLIYTMAFEDPKAGTKRINLILYDVSGEDIENDERLRTYCRFVLNSDALIFLVDPVNMLGLYDDLRLDRLQERPASPADAVLNLVKNFYRDHLEIKFGEPIPIPLAVTISKSDLLKMLSRDSPIFRNSNRGDVLSPEDLKVVDEVVRDLVERHEDPTFVMNCRVFQPHHFFAVAPTGSSPDPDGKYAVLAPCRCLDPFLWVLNQIGIIQRTPVGAR
ncbi:MAG: hypothetical protein JOZ41_15830 [Chloroflexi bacterium]|nr:hypothetical protein [Chloroflexota bacterium]